MQSPFKGYEINETRHANIHKMAPAKLEYIIYFTPRSGSSRLTEVLSQAGGMSLPGECFNPALIGAGMARAMEAKGLDDYIAALRRLRGRDGVFGAQVTYMQILQTFGSERRFLARFGQAVPFWLIREDIVAQAVSITRMRQTKVAHTASADAAALDRAETSFRYHPAGIENCVKRMLSFETRTEAMMKRAGMEPLRLSYERLTALGPEGMVALFRDRLGLEGETPTDLGGAHRKLGTQKNDSFATRFRDENPRFMQKVDRARADRLSKLADLG